MKGDKKIQIIIKINKKIKKNTIAGPKVNLKFLLFQEEGNLLKRIRKREKKTDIKGKTLIPPIIPVTK
jgi:hypothetical protein